MNDSDKKEFAEVMLANGEIYNKEISKSLMQAYFNALTGFTIDQVKNGMTKHALDPKHGTFFPKPADIVRHLQSSELSAEERAEIAWAELERKIRTEGSYGSLVLEDKVAVAAVKGFTSWKDLCMMNTDKMTWAKKEFMSLYGTYDKAPVESLPDSLPGIIEMKKQKQESVDQFGAIRERMDKALENKKGA